MVLGLGTHITHTTERLENVTKNALFIWFGFRELKLLRLTVNIPMHVERSKNCRQTPYLCCMYNCICTINFFVRILKHIKIEYLCRSKTWENLDYISSGVSYIKHFINCIYNNISDEILAAK